jgi:XTP/dITP diphosphohydrolase
MSKATVVLATHNNGKLREYELFFQKYPVKIKRLSEYKKIIQFKENGHTFKEIAIDKARLSAKILGLPVLADDSGLEVEVLNGAPGIFSARYAGEAADDYQNNLKLLEEMKGKENRNAIFVCSIAIAKPSGQVFTYTGKCYGVILKEPAGKSGFGYDPLFYYPALKKTFAQISVKEKSEVSHRGQALRKLGDDFDRILNWLQHS